MITSTMPFSALRLKDDNFVNPRTRSGLEEESIVELAIDIGLRDLIVPLVVTADGLVIAGQRRYRAIEWLITWFTQSDKGRELAREVSLDKPWISGPDRLTHAEVSTIEDRIRILRNAVPVRCVESSHDIEGLALADNVLRSNLSGYEIAARLADLAAKGATGRELARLVGKSTSWVSRKLTAWKGAGAELRRAWELGEEPDDVVLELAQLPYVDQAKALASPVPRGRRGAANRPPIDQVKDVLATLETTLDHRLRGSHPYEAQRVTIQALRWVCGMDVSADFADLINGDGS